MCHANSFSACIRSLLSVLVSFLPMPLDDACSRDQVLLVEKSILGKLEWYLTVPTPYVFLVRYIKSSVLSDPVMENMVLFLAELGLMHYSVIVMYTPSIKGILMCPSKQGF